MTYFGYPNQAAYNTQYESLSDEILSPKI
ncbi:MAG: hypothetical protein RIQ74_393, partial [Pseudomonadota bacterium]